MNVFSQQGDSNNILALFHCSILASMPEIPKIFSFELLFSDSLILLALNTSHVYLYLYLYLRVCTLYSLLLMHTLLVCLPKC